MSRVFLKASQDASIYEVYPTLNTGQDEILEVGKNDGDELNLNLGAVRSLIQFDLTDLKGAPTSSRVFLNLKVAHAEKLKNDATIDFIAVSQSWTEGSGYYLQRPFVSDDGATWNNKSSGSAWALTGSSYYQIGPLISASVADLDNGEIRIELTALYERYLTASWPNYGTLITFPESDEDNTNDLGNIRFFSRQTHTVHEPTLELVWDDFSFSTGSLSAIPNINIKVVPSNLESKYNDGEKALVYFNVRNKYPAKTYTNRLRFENKYYLPSGSQYKITDAQSGTTIVPYDQYSAINCDATGSYILLDTDPLYRKRFYDLQIKIPLGSQIIYSDKYRFEIV